MDDTGGQHAGRRAETVQRAAPCARQHFTTDADLDAEMSGARRPGDAHGLPDHSAARRLRADEARTFVARAREQSGFMGPAKPHGHPRCTAAIRCGTGTVTLTERSIRRRAGMTAAAGWSDNKAVHRGGQSAPHGRCRSNLRITLPVVVIGISSMKATSRGYSWAESRVFTKPWMSAASACDGGCPDLSTMKAFTISVRSASGLPTTPASATAGCRIKQSSIRLGPMR